VTEAELRALVDELAAEAVRLNRHVHDMQARYDELMRRVVLAEAETAAHRIHSDRVKALLIGARVTLERAQEAHHSGTWAMEELDTTIRLAIARVGA
jgi:hypothetical protein